jgi:hypothetical protein
VPEDLLHHPDVNALFEEQRSRRVACIVGSSVAEAGRLQHRLELGPVGPWVDRSAGRSCHQAEMFRCLYLRLDCHRTNTALHNYYLRRGFTLLDVRSAPGRDSGALFERLTETRLAHVGVQLVDGTDGDALFNRPATATA